MNYKNKLVLEMGIFFIIVFGLFTYIVLNEKKHVILLPKVEEKLNKYIDNNYSKEKINLNISKAKYDISDETYKIKLTNSKNKNLYFYVSYKNKKITSTYEKDYKEGKTLYKNFNNTYQKQVKYKNSKIIFPKKLDSYPSTVYEKIINNKIKTLPIYNTTTELTVKSHNEETLVKSINKFYLKIKKLGYNPKEYNFTIVDQNDLTFIVKVSNLDNNLIENNLNEIIRAIIGNDKNIMKKYSIKYEYLA